MENAPDEEPTEFLEPMEPEENVEQHVEHEEVLEEIVHGDEMMYDADGRLIQYQNVVMYEDGSEVIEEYVEVEDLGNGEYAYVMTDEHGNRRLMKPEEVDAVKKEMPMLVEEEIVDHKALPSEPSDGAGPSTSAPYPNKQRGRFPGKANEKSSRASMRDLLGKGGAGMMYVDRAYYHENQAKRLTEMAKVDVEKYVPTLTVNRRPLPDNADFIKPKQHRSRKNPHWQDEQDGASSSSRPSVSARITSPRAKSPLFPPDSDDLVIRFKCNECDLGFANMIRLCDHMKANHDCHAHVRDVEFFNDRDFENFLFKIERQSLGKEGDPHKSFTQSRKSRPGSSQVFVCNYMHKNRKKFPEIAEVGMAALADRPIETCTAFVQKTHSYECIRVKYCDTHIHYDGNIGFRVPLAVKRRLFEMAMKRLPIPCMQVILAHECDSLLQHPSRFEEKLKNLSHVEIVELIGLISTNLTKTHEGLHPIRGKKIPIKFETVSTDEGQETLVVVRANPLKDTADEAEIRNSHSLAFSVDGEEVPMMAREEEVLDTEGEPTPPPDGQGGLLDENMLYDPQNKQDPRFEELTEVELGILEAYERDISVHLSDEQKRERVIVKAKFALAKVGSLYSALDAATHGISSNELHMDTINQLRDMASYVVELVCTLDAEVKTQQNPVLQLEDIRRDMIAGIAMQERVYQPEGRRRRSGNAMHPSPMKSYRQSMHRSNDDYAERIYSKVKALQPPHRSVGINMSGTFDLTAEDRLKALRQQHEGVDDIPSPDEEPMIEEQKPAMVALPPLPDNFKAMPWTKPPRKRHSDSNTPARKRGRPNKKTDAAVAMEVVAEDVIAAQVNEIVAASQESSGALETSGALELPRSPEPPKVLKTAEVPQEDSADTDKDPVAPITTSAETPPQETTTDETASLETESVEEPAPKQNDVEEEEVPTPSVREKKSVKVETPKKSQTKQAEKITTPVKVPEDSGELSDATTDTPTSSAPPVTTTTTRTGRIVKPKKWGDE